jgi:hypothetical protein
LGTGLPKLELLHSCVPKLELGNKKQKICTQFTILSCFVVTPEPPHRLHLCIPQDNGGPGPGAARYASSQGSGQEEFGPGSAGVSPAEDAMGLRVAGGTPALPGCCPPDCGVMRLA